MLGVIVREKRGSVLVGSPELNGRMKEELATSREISLLKPNNAFSVVPELRFGLG
jgi:hypothetical protein